MQEVKAKFQELNQKYKWDEKNWKEYKIDTLPDGVTLPNDFKFTYKFPSNDVQEWVIEDVNEIPEYVSPIKNIQIEEVEDDEEEY